MGRFGVEWEDSDQSVGVARSPFSFSTFPDARSIVLAHDGEFKGVRCDVDLELGSSVSVEALLEPSFTDDEVRNDRAFMGNDLQSVPDVTPRPTSSESMLEGTDRWECIESVSGISISTDAESRPEASSTLTSSTSLSVLGLSQIPPLMACAMVSMNGMSSQFGNTSVSLRTSLMRLSIALSIGPYVICRELTIGSTDSSMRGGVSKVIQRRLLGGGLMRRSICPSNRFK